MGWWWGTGQTGQEPLDEIHRLLHDSKSQLGSVVLYVTTHGSEQHMTFLECQPQWFLAHSPRLSKADVILYVGQDNITDDMKDDYNRLLDKWPLRKKIIHFEANFGKQAGAMRAMHVGFSSGWFREYDWVIRVNPDVVIYDESQLFHLMEDTETQGIFVPCKFVDNNGHPVPCEIHSGCALPALRCSRNSSQDPCPVGPFKTHTDFFAVRPSFVPHDAFADWHEADYAEFQATRAFSDIYEAKADAYLEGAQNQFECRVKGGGVWHTVKHCPSLVKAHPGWFKGT